jgi:PAS domain S-box-containing protein
MMLILLAGFLILIGGLIFSVVSGVGQSLELNERNARTNLENALDSYRREAFGKAAMLAESPLIKSVLADGNGLSVMEQADFARLQERVNTPHLWVYDHSGKLLLESRNNWSTGLNERDHALLWEQAVKNRSVYQLAILKEQVLLQLAVPVYKNSRSQSVSGVLVMGVALDAGFLVNIREVSGVETLLFMDERVIATSFGAPLQTPDIKEARSGLTHIGINGTRFDLSRTSLWGVKEGAGLQFYFASDNERMHARLQNTIFGVLSIALVLTLLAYYLSSSIAHQIVSSVRGLVDGMGQLKANQFEGKIELDSSDEFGRIADEVNKMAFQIMEFARELIREEHRFEALFSESPLPMLIMVQGRPFQANTFFTRQFGYSIDDVASETQLWEKLCPDSDQRKEVLERWSEQIKLIEEGVEAEPLLVRLTTQAGNVREIELSYRHIEDQGVIVFYDLTDRCEAENALAKSERRLHYALSATSDAIWEWEYLTGKTYYSPRWFTMLGYDSGDLEMTLETWKQLCHPDDYPETVSRIGWMISDNRPDGFSAEFRMRHRDGGWRWILGRGNIVERTESGEPFLISGTNTDITVRKLAEQEQTSLQEQLLQAQKMESVGRLAGGVAHDFNNMLGVMISHAELALLKSPRDEKVRANLEEILKAAERSSDLTRQLLAFARRQTVAPVVLDLNEVISDMLQMLGRLIGEEIDLVWQPATTLHTILMDPSQVNQVLTNLVINARDAIGGAGNITIETGDVTFDERYCKTHPDCRSGEYVMLAVSDTGCGMDKSVLTQLFEPFFTTKPQGQGTGLGLPMVYGIVRQNGGFINVYSEPGEGSTFRLYFKQARQEKTVAVQSPSKEGVLKGTETILLVEDEPALCKSTEAYLEELGYRVLAVGSPVEALEMLKRFDEPIELLLTDVVMPEMNGRQLLEKIKTQREAIRCVYMSGYTANVIAHHGVLEDGIVFIEKPFMLDKLAVKIREALDPISE